MKKCDSREIEKNLFYESLPILYLFVHKNRTLASFVSRSLNTRVYVRNLNGTKLEIEKKKKRRTKIQNLEAIFTA